MPASIDQISNAFMDVASGTLLRVDLVAEATNRPSQSSVHRIAYLRGRRRPHDTAETVRRSDRRRERPPRAT
jgi:hypothetical protein